MINDYTENFNKHEFFYHYTTVESLLFILVNRVLKFNKVDYFNDISESTRNQYVKFFASCLTYSNEESIPLWHIYANKRDGVRLKISNTNIFGEQFYFFNENGEKIYETTNDKILRGQVEYDDELANRSPSSGNDYLRLTNVYYAACQKRKIWSYEEELRYFIDDDRDKIKDAKCLYVLLMDKFFEDLVITFNPFMPEYKKHIIIEAVRNLSYNITFEDSNLRGTIR